MEIAGSWLSRRRRLTSPEGTAVAVRTRDGFDAEGARVVLRPWTPIDGLAGLRAGTAQGIADDWPEPWFTSVHMRDDQVLGAIPPTMGRLGLALCTGLLGLVGRGGARLVRGDRARWAVRGQERRVAVDAASGGIHVHVVGTDEAAGLEGRVLRAVRAHPGETWVRIVGAMVEADPDGVPDGWLGLCVPTSEAASIAVWTAWIEEEPELSARLLQEALIGLGCLATGSS